jgi:hypothetical protein
VHIANRLQTLNRKRFPTNAAHRNFGATLAQGSNHSATEAIPGRFSRDNTNPKHLTPANCLSV